MTPETRIVRAILQDLKKGKGFWFKTHGSIYQQAGLPDIIGCYRGWFVAFEVKTPDTEKDVSRRQALMMARIKRANGTVKVVTSVEQVREVLEAIL